MAHEIGLERPYLKFFGGNALVVRLSGSDFVEQPVSAAVIGEALGAVRENHLRVRERNRMAETCRAGTPRRRTGLRATPERPARPSPLGEGRGHA